MSSLPRADLAIYSPFASVFYDRRAAQRGGAELQMTLLAEELAKRGWRVAHIVLPIAEPAQLEPPGPAPFEREPYGGAGKLGRLREAAAVWRALRAVDARMYVFRGSAANVAVASTFCRMHRRSFVFSAANDFDLVREPADGSNAWLHRVYLHGLRRADAVVAQSARQIELSRGVLRPGQVIVQIPSFAQAAAPAANPFPRSLLWISRITPHKRPREFLRLAREVPEARFTMIAVEDIDHNPGLSAQIRREAAVLDNFELLGPQRRDLVLDRIASASAVVSTSDWEGMPNIFLEAWGRAVPVLSLSFDPDGLIESRGLGIVAGDSWPAFVAGARRLWSDTDARARYGSEARRYIQAHHSPDAVGDCWESLLGRVDRLRRS